VDEFGKVLVVPFNIFFDPKYHRIKVAGDEVIFQPSLPRFEKVIKKFEMLSIKEE
jgi:hypothetical protein